MGTSLERRLGRPYRPAIVRLSLTPGSRGDATLDLLYLPPQGDVQGWRLDVPEVRLRSLIARLQEQLSRMEQPDLEAPGTASSQLSQLLLQPLLPALRKDGINALLLSVDRGLQAIPYAALPVAPGVLLGDAYALTLTPSLGLTNLAATAGMAVQGRMLLGGSSRFPNGLADLPLVRQELQTWRRRTAPISCSTPTSVSAACCSPLAAPTTAACIWPPTPCSGEGGQPWRAFTRPPASSTSPTWPAACGRARAGAALIS